MIKTADELQKEFDEYLKSPKPKKITKTRPKHDEQPDRVFTNFIAQDHKFFVSVKNAYGLYKDCNGQMGFKAFSKALKSAGYERRAFKYDGKLQTLYTKRGVNSKTLWAKHLTP